MHFIKGSRGEIDGQILPFALIGIQSSTSIDAQSSSIILVGYDSPACYTSDSHILTGLPIRCLKDETASINEDLNQQPMIVYPNPAKDLLLVSCQLLAHKNAVLTITNITGQVIYKMNSTDGQKAEPII